MQTSKIAGFQYYQGEKVWQQLNKGDALTLKAEPTNKYDKNAVEIYWQDQKIGYLPRTQNYTVSQMLQNQQNLIARVEKKQMSSDFWERVVVEIFTV